MHEFGVSLSVKQCRNFGISSEACLTWLAKDCGFQRFRLMSYWDEIELVPGEYDFKELDRQLEIVKKYNGTVSLCLGARQPRWPENHWPEWAWKLSKDERTEALLDFLKVAVERYKTNDVIVSYQLENEALLTSFGTRSEVDRRRLRKEYSLVKRLDPNTPIIMTTSTSWGIPVRKPIPDIVGFSYYQTIYNAKRKVYTTAFRRPWHDAVRAFLIRVIWHRPSFIHELQLEPWGPKSVWEMSVSEQMKSMDERQIRKNIELAKQTGLKTIDLWGGEWWYWCHVNHGNSVVAQTVLHVTRVNSYGKQKMTS